MFLKRINSTTLADSTAKLAPLVPLAENGHVHRTISGAAKTSVAAPKCPTVTVDRLLQINLAVLVPLGTFLLGMGEHNFLLTTILLLVAVASIFAIDRWGWIELNRLAANLAGLGVALYSMVRFFLAGSEDQLLVIANLLVYLQIVLLLQRKTHRVGWQLLVLSVLEVVTATALNLSILFGLLLAVYVFVALATLGLLFIQTETFRLRALAQSQLVRWSPAPSNKAEPRWPLRREIQVAMILPADLPQQILGRGILGRTALFGLGVMVVAGICFFFLPRFGKAILDPIGQQASIGFSPAIKLGDLGPLLENPELVMQVELREAASDAPVNLRETPLLRGSLINRYQHGEWRPTPTQVEDLRKLSKAPRGADLVRERILIQPQQEAVVFAVYPPYEADLRSGRRVRFDQTRQQLSRTNRDARDGEFEYELLTTGVSQGRQLRIIPQSQFPPLTRAASDLQQMANLQMPDESPAYGAWRNGDDTSPASSPTDTNPDTDPVDRLTGLRAAAATRIRDRKLDPDNYYAVAKSLETMLGSPPFEYTLERPPAQSGVDPIEDFVVRNRRGHCEYFASALTLMLRSQGIPAQMVIGFRGGDWNAAGSFYTVRQLHAHAWVEAFLDADHVDDIPKSELPGKFDGRQGAWLVLDPTPALDNDENTFTGTWRSRIAGISNYLQVMWSTYVVGLNADRQEKAIFKPLSELGQTVQHALTSPARTASGLATHLWQWLFGGAHGERPAFDWEVVLALAILIALIYATYRIGRMTARWIGPRKRRRASSATRRRINPVEFYRRLETLLARHGLRRGKAQTQLEFAQAAGHKLQAKFGLGAACLPRQLVESFYRIRFGGQALDSAESQAVEQVLDELTETLRRGPHVE